MSWSEEGSPGAVALRACLREVDALARAYLLEVRGVTGYPEAAIADEELLATARESLEYLLRLVAGLPVTSDRRSLSREVGRRRARQGIPLESLLRAVRMDFRFIWNALREHVSDEDLVAFSDGVLPIWDAVELHLTDVHSGYLAELTAMRRQAEHERVFLLRSLFEAERQDPHLVRQVARALDADARDLFAVAVAAPGREAELRAAAAGAGADDMLVDLDSEVLALLRCTDPGGAPPAWLLGLPVGLAPTARGVAEIPRMRRVAARLARAVRPGDGRALRVRSDWPAVVVRELGDVAEVLAEEVLAPLYGLPERERSALVETALAVLERGSVSEATHALYCHRNTVLNRLRRFEELTGRNPARPGDGALVLLSLEVARGRGNTADPSS
ncbi:helix-turn-helix domain-containing protein [Nocardiopsis tropica]|uniref:Helix-turn-helix domain-containing protein n=1 Tax=Nocardiopsis tropica TaxID=109330 RepID=A0ABU7KYT8_9ACTN|nr:helix-turn-helix domain-containing protein [Nocardiopsis umidischolae]MEE2054482.1 helix-turn-helix domain-containing protein [Nocardiopsis umidischolae]